ncbi:uncharacterized protein LOC143880722 [Tasmannia lanceolata]|uniref:uncharacterized protein LOC143880722 n=1 Tax=Tasmannia lanceolata TaxID=3420 RepID=UPI004063BE32
MGTLLAATAIDGNNGLFPLALAVVEAETYDSWVWFLHLFRQNFISAGRDVITIGSDRMKGLLRAVAEALPRSYHFYCIHQLSANFHEKFKSEDLRKNFMNAAYSLREGAFKDAMESIKSMSKSAEKWISEIPKRNWASAYFEGSKWTTRLTPNAEDWLADERILAGDYMAHQCGWTVYEVKSKYHVDEVDIEKNACTCRLFQTMGMSCSHAIAAMGLDQRDPYSYYEEWYHADTYRRTYDGAIYPTDLDFVDRNCFEVYPACLLVTCFCIQYSFIVRFLQEVRGRQLDAAPKLLD